MTEAFQRALAAIDAGYLNALTGVLRAHPEVVHERKKRVDGLYAGYFARATLLHLVAGNPVRCPMPMNTLEPTGALIDAEADVNATVSGGPEQPHTEGGNQLGLVADTAGRLNHSPVRELLS
jgi:hypothetical protein